MVLYNPPSCKKNTQKYTPGHLVSRVVTNDLLREPEMGLYQLVYVHGLEGDIDVPYADRRSAYIHAQICRHRHCNLPQRCNDNKELVG